MSKQRAKMPVAERAKQFMPFAALRGLPDALRAKERITLPKRELCDDEAAELNEKMQHICRNTMVSVVYYSCGEYIRLTGMVARLDTALRTMQIVETKISFDDILDIELP